MRAEAPSPERAEAMMRELLASEGLPEPDEVIHDEDHDELVLLWNEPRTAVVIELGEE